jgi:hypothetical protein
MLGEIALAVRERACLICPNVAGRATANVSRDRRFFDTVLSEPKYKCTFTREKMNPSE